MTTLIKNIILIYSRSSSQITRKRKEHRDLLEEIKDRLGKAFVEKEFIVVDNIDEAKREYDKNPKRIELVIAEDSNFFKQLSMESGHKYVGLTPGSLTVQVVADLVQSM